MLHMGSDLRAKDVETESSGFGRASRLFNKKALVAGLLLILSAATWYPRRRGPLDLRWDSSVYYVLGTSLAHGEGYRLLNEPGDISAAQYPPLTSAIIALHEKALGTSDPFVVATWLKLTWFLCFLLVIAGTYFVLAKFIPRSWAAFGAFVCICNFPMYFNFNQAASEVPLTVASIVFLMAYYRIWSRTSETIAGFAAVAAFFARTAGVVVLLAWAADAVLRKQFRRAILRALITIVCVSAWGGYIHSVESSREYKHPAYAYQRADYMYSNVSYAGNMTYNDPLRPELGRVSARDLVARVMRNVIRSPQRLGEAITSQKNRWQMHSATINSRVGFTLVPMQLVSLFLFFLGSLVLAGMFILLIQREFLIPIWLCTSVIVACAAPWPIQQVRYLSTILPLILLGLFKFLLTGEQVLAVRWPQWRRTWSAIAGALLLLIPVYAAIDYYHAQTHFFNGEDLLDKNHNKVVYRQLLYGQDLLAMDEAIGWVAEQAQSGDIIAASMPQWVYLRTGLKSVMPPLEPNPEKASYLLDTVPVRYLVQETPGFFPWPYVNGVVKAYPDKWRLVFKASADQVPEALFSMEGYWCYWHGEKGYSGVALHVSTEFAATRPACLHPEFNFENRIAVADIGDVTVASVYVPNGGKDYRWASSPTDYANFMAAVVRHYTAVRRFVVFSEPTQFANFEPQGNHGKTAPHVYARLLDAAYGAMHHARPNVIVIGGNMHPSGTDDARTTAPDTFLRNLVLPNGRRSISSLASVIWRWAFTSHGCSLVTRAEISSKSLRKPGITAFTAS